MSDPKEDDLMEDIPGEIPKPSNLDDPAPNFYTTIWKDPHLTKVFWQGLKK